MIEHGPCAKATQGRCIKPLTSLVVGRGYKYLQVCLVMTKESLPKTNPK